LSYDPDVTIVSYEVHGEVNEGCRGNIIYVYDENENLLHYGWYRRGKKVTIEACKRAVAHSLGVSYDTLTWCKKRQLED